MGKLQKRFPAAFPKSPAPKVALKVGIIDDLLAHGAELQLSEQELRDTLRVWCQGARYWSAQAKNAPRVDLYGTTVGTVSLAESARARRLRDRSSPRSKSARGAEPTGS
ncbi:ProQ/FinO family protein [Caballeronia grimmiae]|uniref:ProQ/FinO family protein n=1 Tax=Caballeronia grimmiae TaxID=1071679 RepID=UPI0038BCC0E3